LEVSVPGMEWNFDVLKKGKQAKGSMPW
jgi:hypothetical protein